MTTAAVPSTNTVDFLLNVEAFDKAINSNELTFNDRLGNSKSTLSAAIDSIKAFNNRGAFTGATSYAIKDVYTYSGIAYVTVVAHTSSTVASDLAAGKVTIHQGLTKEELALSSGASIVGFIQSGVGAVKRTAQSKLRELVSVLDFYANGVSGASVDPTGVVDSTAGIQAACNSGAVSILFPAGTYKISGTVTFFTYQTLIGAGARKTQVVNTNSAVFAFKAVGVSDSGADWQSGLTYGRGSFQKIDVRSRYGVAINGVNTSNAPSYDYASPAAFYAANVPVIGFRVSDCIFIEDAVYANGATWMASQPTYNSATIPTMQQLYTAGIGVLFSNVYEGIVEDNTFLYFGCGVLLYGADISEARNNRFGTNLRHGWAHSPASSCGHQTEWNHNDCLANLSIGGITVDGANHKIDDNYFENVGGGASAINGYILDNSYQVIISDNRFDDYGSTITSLDLIYLAGYSGGQVRGNRINDNRPSGAGTLANIYLDSSHWNPSERTTAKWGLYQFVKNDTLFPRKYHPLIQYDLDGDPLKYFPLQKHRDIGFTDISGGSVHNTICEFQDANGLWYYNEGARQNPHKFYPDSTSFAAKGPSLIFTITFHAMGKVASPTTVGGYINWTNGFGVADTPTFPSFTFTNTTDREIKTASYTLASGASLEGGYFEVWLDPKKANTYGITIA